MPRKKTKKTPAETKLYMDLFDIIFPTCATVYSSAKATNNVLALGKITNTGTGVMPPVAALEALIELCDGHCDKSINKIDTVARRLTILEKSGLSGDNLTAAVNVCNSFFDNYQTTADLVIHLAKDLLDLSDDTFDEVYDVYMGNLTYFANNIAKNPSIVDGPYFSLDTLILMVTLGILPSTLLTPQVVEDNNATRVFERKVLDQIFAGSHNINDATVTSNLVVLSGQVPPPPPSSQTQPPPTPSTTNIPSPPPQQTPPPSPSSSLAKAIILDLIDHCGSTWRNAGIDVGYLYTLDKDPSFYKPIDEYITNTVPNETDFKSIMSSLMDEIDCKLTVPYLKSRSGGELRGAALTTSFSNLVRRVVTCGIESGGDPNLFARCIEGEEIRHEPVQGEIEAEQESADAYTFTGIFDDLLVKSGLQPAESYDKSVSMIKYFLSLLKQYGLNTNDYTKLSSILSQPKIASDVDKILEKIPEQYRKDILSALTTLLSTLSSYPPSAQEKAMDLFNNIAMSAMGSSNPSAYFDSLMTLFLDVATTIPSPNDRISMFNAMDRLVKTINLYPEDERDKVLEAIDFTLKRLEEYKAKYPQFTAVYLKSTLYGMLDKLKEDLEKVQKPVEKVPQSKAPQPVVKPVTQKPATPTQEEEEEEEGEAKAEEIVDRDQLVDIITKAHTECNAIAEGETVSGPCIVALYFRLYVNRPQPSAPLGSLSELYTNSITENSTQSVNVSFYPYGVPTPSGTPKRAKSKQTIPSIPMLYVPYNNKVYVIGDSDYGMSIASVFDGLVGEIARTRPGIIGTKIALLYVTHGTQDLPNGSIHPFIPFIPPNNALSPVPVYAYDPNTLPAAYYNRPFVDVVDTDEVHLLYSRDDQTTWLVIPSVISLTKGDIIKVVMGNGGSQIMKWGEMVYGK